MRNSAQGVEIEAHGTAAAVAAFVSALRANPPKLAHIDHFDTKPLPEKAYSSFEILESQDLQSDFLPVSPDLATCPECLSEILHTSERRYRYPFTNCTHCGPRFSILQRIPYDRPNTSMSPFKLCQDCLNEYTNPGDRRFHAQPIACPYCGPQLWFQADGKTLARGDEALRLAETWLEAGKVLALKGLGGFHLACNALNFESVETLRKRKRRSAKPFALMAGTLETFEKYCHLSTAARNVLQSPQAPIVLLPLTELGRLLAAQVAPGQSRLGFMLPYTPMHHLLFNDMPNSVLVMTSANLSEEPIAFSNQDAMTKLQNLADGFLMHDRPIEMRIDDSVVTMLDNQPYFIRRARGYAPEPILLPFESPTPILATGAELKNTFTLVRDRYAFISHYIGDLENLETLNAYEEAIRHYEALFRVRPAFLAADLHPDYLATRYAQQRAAEEGTPLLRVQHHHAHIASCMAENSWNSEDPVIGLAYDGTGYGTDGTIWGGEVLISSYREFTRAYHLLPFALPGGDAAIRTPARQALALLNAAQIPPEEYPHLAPLQFLTRDEIAAVNQQLATGFNTPVTTSMGRLFDAVSALLGICQKITYEGQAAIEMEALCDQEETAGYPFLLSDSLMDPRPMVLEMIKDLGNGIAVHKIAARFHNTIVQMSLEVCRQVRDAHGLQNVAFSGGVWQNILLLQRSKAALEKDGFKVLIHQHLPPNDACISLGQAAIAGWQLLHKE